MRNLHSLVQDACDRRGIEVAAYSDGWVLELKKNTEIHRIVGAQFDFNDQAAVAIACDKVAASVLFEQAGIPHIPHYLLQSIGAPTMNHELLSGMLQTAPVVIKPLKGSRGEFVSKVHTAEAAVDLLAQGHETAWAVSPFVDIAAEIRLIVLNGEVCVAYKKINPPIINELKVFNLNKGATAEQIKQENINPEYRKLAISAMHTIGLKFGAVDLVIPVDSSEVSVLEINAAFSLAHYQKTNTATAHEVAVLYDRVVAELFRAQD